MDNLLLGFQVALSWQTLFYCFFGVLLGTLVGVLPGIGASAAVSMLLPISYYLDPTTALVMLSGVYYGAQYGGSTASILLNLPGDSSSAITCLDGHAMTREGRAGVALFTAAVSSFVGGSIGIVILTFLTPAIVSVALSFGPAEYFAVMLLGLLAAAGVAQGSPLKGLAMVGVGLILGMTGIDVNTGETRFAFGQYQLFDGYSLVIVAMGLFGVSEVIASMGEPLQAQLTKKITMRSMLPNRDDVRRSVLPVLRGTAVGSFFGALPATGPTLSAILSYSLEKRISRRPEKFGHGAIEGVAGPEASNNAASQTSFIPTLALGIPGSATMAIMLGAMMVHGISPGPLLMVDHPDVFWGLVASFWIGNLLLLILNIPMIGIWVRLLSVPYHLLHPAIICLICIGVYSINTSAFEVWLVLGFGLLGYLMRLLRFEPAPLLIGFVLGPMIEENFRRAMLLAGGDFAVLFQRPVSGTILAVTFLILVWMIWYNFRRRSLQRQLLA